MELVTRLDDWFIERLANIDYSEMAKAYVAGVLSSVKTTSVFSRHESLVLAFDTAKRTNSFELFQRIGDWVMWAEVMDPDIIEEHRSVTEATAQLSYYACSKILQNQWPVYVELANNLPELVVAVRAQILSR